MILFITILYFLVFTPLLVTSYTPCYTPLHCIKFTERRKNNLRLSTSTDIRSEYTIRSLSVMDFPSVARLTFNEFCSICQSNKDKVELVATIFSLFVPKLINKKVWQHEVLGVYSSTGLLAAFVDISLQPCTGLLEALVPTTYEERLGTYVSKGIKLEPYICNFMVSPEFRRKGLAKLLLKECESFAKEGVLIMINF